jgi:hypothetical protein
MIKREIIFPAAAVLVFLHLPKLAATAKGAQTSVAAITHVTDPTVPAKLSVLVGDGWDLNDPVVRAWRLPDGEAGAPPSDSVPGEDAAAERLAVVQRAPQTLTVVAPAGTPGLVAFQARGKSGWSEPYLVNRPRVEWLSTDVAAPGSIVRAFGRNLASLGSYFSEDSSQKSSSWGGYVRTPSRVVLRGRNRFIEAQIVKASFYDLHFRLPEELAEGSYEIFVHSGHGGRQGWSSAQTFRVERRRPWPGDVYDVALYGAKGDGSSDDTGAVETALDRARNNRGGVVFFPPGNYFVSRAIRIPDRTILRGASRERSWILFPDNRRRKLASAMPIAIVGERSFGIERLSVHAVYPQIVLGPQLSPGADSRMNGVQSVDYEAQEMEDVFLRDCRVYQDPTFLVHYREREPFLQTRDRWRYFAAVALRGSRISVSNCAIKGAGMPVIFLNSRYFRLADNELYVGTGGNALNVNFQGSTLSEKYVFEDNTIWTTTDSIGAGHGMFLGTRHGYVARNRIPNYMWTGDNEAILYHSYAWRVVARVRSVQGRRIEIEGEDVKNWWQRATKQGGKGFLGSRYFDQEGNWLAGSIRTGELVVISGRALGQAGTIVAHAGASVTLDRPWKIEPQAGDLLAISDLPQIWRTYTIENEVNDAGTGVMHWGNAFDCIIDGNRLTRNRGIIVWSLSDYRGTYAGFGGGYFNQIVHNTLSGGWLELEEGFRGYLGARMYEGSGGIDLLSLVIRDNRLADDTAIAVTRPVKITIRGVPAQNALGIVVEGNYIRDSLVGVSLPPNVNAAVRKNRFDKVNVPLEVPEGTWVQP